MTDRGGAPRYIDDDMLEAIRGYQGHASQTRTAMAFGVDRSTVRRIWGDWRPKVRRYRELALQPVRIRQAGCRQ